MAESSRFWTTSGTGDGPAGGYTAQQFYDFLRKLLITDQQASQGVIFGESNELAVTGSASPLSVATGSAIAYGFFYENTAVVSPTVTTPTIGTTGGRVNLKVDWTAQTVRVVVNRNTDGIIAIPALTQTPGSVYEIPLATFTITTGGVIALTDARVFIEVGSRVLLDSVDTEAIQDSAVTAIKIANRTRHFFVPASNIYVGATQADRIDLAGFRAVNGSISLASGEFAVPLDYASTMTVKSIYQPAGSGNIYTKCEARYGSAGEAYSNHTASDGGYAAVAVTDAQLSIGQSVSIASAATGDIVTMTWFRDAANALDTVEATVYFKGWLVEYTADS